MAQSYRQRVKRQGDKNARERELENLKFAIEQPLLTRIHFLELEKKQLADVNDQLRKELHAVAVLAKVIHSRTTQLASGKSEIT